MKNEKSSAFILALGIFLGLACLGYFLANAAIKYKEYERTVRVKGLSEREYPADIVIWPIRFTRASNELNKLYTALEKDAAVIGDFLQKNGVKQDALSYSIPIVNDKSANSYNDYQKPKFRYTATQLVTVYSDDIEIVQKNMKLISQLGKQGVSFSGNEYDSRAEYIFNRLNEVKPEMIEEATRKAREVAIKFAEDSDSKLGKIKSASQGQFSINQRDKNNPHIKKVRIVSTITYYLSD